MRSSPINRNKDKSGIKVSNGSSRGGSVQKVSKQKCIRSVCNTVGFGFSVLNGESLEDFAIKQPVSMICFSLLEQRFSC